MTTEVVEPTAPAATWPNGVLRCPVTGAPLRRDSPHSLSSGERRYPVVDDIPFLRTGREALREKTLALLDAGWTEEATVGLLSDRDDWARGAGPHPDDLRTLIRTEPELTLRAAMRLLAYGPVADYFAYRWSDPTFLSGLKLLDVGLPAGAQRVVEVACGIGHYLRECAVRDIRAAGVDVVFSKLWLARKFVAPDAQLVCADVASGLPFSNAFSDAVFCHDAFYFLPEKRKVANEMLRVSSGPVLIGHTHNREADNFSSGAPWGVEEYAALLPSPVLYDDNELTRALIEDRRPVGVPPDALRTCAAVSLIGRPSPGADEKGFASFEMPLEWQPVSDNPLLKGAGGEMLQKPAWPSDRYAAEYGPLMEYLALDDDASRTMPAEPSDDLNSHMAALTIDLIRRRHYLALPQKW